MYVWDYLYITFARTQGTVTGRGCGGRKICWEDFPPLKMTFQESKETSKMQSFRDTSNSNSSQQNRVSVSGEWKSGYFGSTHRKKCLSFALSGQFSSVQWFYLSRNCPSSSVPLNPVNLHHNRVVLKLCTTRLFGVRPNPIARIFQSRLQNQLRKDGWLGWNLLIK